MYSILTVCLGNICRSPLAQGILEHHCDPLTVWVDSAGTSSHHRNAPPDPRAQEIALRNGIDIGAQRSRVLRPEDLSSFDLILAMDHRNFRHCRQLAATEEQRSRIVLFLERYGPKGISEVPDPYYGDMEDFEYVYELLYHASLRLVDDLKNAHGAGIG